MLPVNDGSVLLFDSKFDNYQGVELLRNCVSEAIKINSGEDNFEAYIQTNKPSDLREDQITTVEYQFNN